MGANVVDLLIADHREVEELLRELVAEESAERRRELVDTVIGQLVRHAVAEETIVYPMVSSHVPDGAAAVEHDKQEHKQVETILKEMEGAEAGGPEFFDLVGRLQAVLDDHIADEEEHQLPQLRAALDEQTLMGMGRAVEALKLVAPTRPHPQAPQSALFHLTVGPGVGLVDRLRDLLSSKTTTYTGAST
jgi:hemerythrin superfamily protein